VHATAPLVTDESSRSVAAWPVVRLPPRTYHPGMTQPASSLGMLDRIERVLAETYADGHVTRDDGGKIPVYPTGTDEGQGRGIRRLIVEGRAAKTFEVGFALGLSTLNIAAGLVEVGAPGASHTSIDPTEAVAWGNAGRRLVERAGLDLVEIIEESSHTVLPRWVAEGRCDFDIAFIDGDHRYDPCFADVFFADRLVRAGGLIILDDMWMPSVRMVAAFYESNIGYELLTGVIPDAFSWNCRMPWHKVRQGTNNTAVLRKPAIHTQRPDEHFLPFW
jgi:predicted O-methyltransferase YrrM